MENVKNNNLMSTKIQAYENSKDEKNNVLDEAKSISISDVSNRNIIGAPTRCPEGYRPDSNGKCRKILNYMYEKQVFLNQFFLRI